MHIILSVVVGSRAYGLANELSDTDRLAVFAVNTEDLFGLKPIKETVVSTAPDITSHEVRKYCRLAINANPTVLELLWLPNYEIETRLGRELIAIRTSFLSQRAVKNSYLGYATQQLKRIETRGDGSFSSDLRKRTAKHARHLARLLTQGYELYTTGTMMLQLENPQWYIDFGERVANGDLDYAKMYLVGMEDKFVQSPLPLSPELKMIERWMKRVRSAHLTS